MTSDLPLPWSEKERIVLLLSELSELGRGGIILPGVSSDSGNVFLWLFFFFLPLFPCTWVNRSFVLDPGGVDVPDTDGPCRPRPCDEPTKEGGTEDLS